MRASKSEQAKRDRANKEARRLRLLADPSLAEHGTTNTYGGWGCRCDECKTAWSEAGRARRAGVRTGPRKGRPAVERFWKRVTKSGGCWIWSGASTAKGYGRIMGDNGKATTAHRFSYELHRGPIPSGLQVDHMCHNKMCVNPDHLRAVDQAANLQNRAGAQRSSKSGIRGVHFTQGQWRVQVTVNGSRHSAGPFATAEQAEEVAVAMRRALMPNSLRDRAPTG